MISTGERKRDIIRTVAPDIEDTTIAFASISMDIAHTEWEIASIELFILKAGDE